VTVGREVSAKALREAVLEGAEDPIFWLRFFLPHWFPTPMPPFHFGLAALVSRQVSFLTKYPDTHEFLFQHFRYSADPEDDQAPMLPIFQDAGAGRIRMVAGQNNAYIIPRGFSKTTLLNGLICCSALTDPHTFCVYISESSTHAQTQLANIRAELEANHLLRQAYGDQVPTRADSEKWTSDQLQLLGGAVLVAKGRGSQVRGINVRARRPNKILLDDVEDKESVSTEPQRDKTIDWFYNSVVPAGNEMSGAAAAGIEQEPLQITLLGTLLGAETLLTEVARDPTFNTVRFGAVLRDEHSELTDADMLWPYKMSAADYLAKRQQYARVGQLSGFCLEFDSTIRNNEDAPFSRKDFYYEPIQRNKLIQVSIAMDPAISDTPGRDHTAIVVAGRDERGVIYILDVWGGLGIKPREKIDKFFELFLLWQCTKAGIEAQGYQRALIYLMQEEMARKHTFFTVTPIIQSSELSKDQRILGILQPRYANGYIKHHRRFGQLETQLLDYPNGKKDYADAEAMALTLLGETMLLATPANSPVTQDQFEPLDKALPPLYPESDNFYFPAGADPLAGRYGGPI
jgi:hypothetical protein